MELMDVYDRDGNLTGAVKDKDAQWAPDEYRLAVGIWIISDEGKLLITRRSMEKSFAPGKWENTAGHVHAGEPCEQAIIRELKEETGIAITQEQITLLGKVCVWPYLGRNYGVHLNTPISAVTCQKGETDAAKWVDFEEFVRMCLREEVAPSVVAHLQDYKESFLQFVGHPEETRL